MLYDFISSYNWLVSCFDVIGQNNYSNNALHRCSNISHYLSALEINQHPIGFIEYVPSFPYHLCKRAQSARFMCKRNVLVWRKRLKKAILSASKVKQVYWWEEESQLSWEGRRNGKAYKSCQAVFSIWLKLNWLISFHRNGILVHSTQFAMSMYQHKKNSKLLLKIDREWCTNSKRMKRCEN